MAASDYTAEQWRAIPNFPNYVVSNRGAVRRLPDGRHPNGVVLKLQNDRGYRYISLWSGGVAKRLAVHRLVCQMFNGECPPGKTLVAHWDGNRGNNYSDNLRWATSSENSEDGKRLGETLTGENHWTRIKPCRVARGGRNGCSKLAVDQVHAIRASAGSDIALGAEYGVTASAIYLIRKRKNWAHI